MSSAIMFQQRAVWGTNGAIEEILQRLIRHAPEDSALLRWALAHYREFFPGICCDLSPLLTSPAAVGQWQEAIAQALDEIRSEGAWTELGQAWLAAEREPLMQIAADAFAQTSFPVPETLRPQARNPWLATRARHWLGDVLLPLALTAAGLPADTPPDAIAPLELPARRSDAESRAWSFCCELPLLGAVAIADALAGDEPSRLLCLRIAGLIWRAALERVHARDLAFDTNLPGIDNREYELARENAEEAWARWEATGERLGPELLEFASLCGDFVFGLSP